MTLEEIIKTRSGGKCELSGVEEGLMMYSVLPQDTANEDNTVCISEICVNQIEKDAPAESDFWQFLSDSMWSEVAGIKVLSWRMLNRFKEETWASELLDMLYIDDETLDWAKALGDQQNETEAAVVHKDSNGNVLQNGDSITLTKSLDVKGSSINARIGTAVRNIRLVADNADQIEGRIDGQQIVILTKFVKKQG